MIDNIQMPDEMLASFIDGSATPLEQSVVESMEHDESLAEVLDIVSDATNFAEVFPVESIEGIEAIDSYIRSVENFQDLNSFKSNNDDKTW